MNQAHRLMRASLLAVWFVSLLAWIYVAFQMVLLDLLYGEDFFYWPLGMIAFILSFASFVIYLTFWWRSNRKRSSAWRFTLALLLTTWVYSFLLFAYVLVRVMINKVPINDPFIDSLLPWFTFLRLSIAAFIIGLVSFLAYLTISRRSSRKLVAEHSR